MDVNTRDGSDPVSANPWETKMSALFNDISFIPEPVSNLAGGILYSDISVVDPGKCDHQRSPSKLKSKFGEFNSLYGTCLARFEQTGQEVPENFIRFAHGLSYIMYAHCFLEKFPVLKSLVTRALPTDVRREDGITDLNEEVESLT